jgi:hypothetical protein
MYPPFTADARAASQLCVAPENTNAVTMKNRVVQNSPATRNFRLCASLVEDSLLTVHPHRKNPEKNISSAASIGWTPGSVTS